MYLRLCVRLCCLSLHHMVTRLVMVESLWLCKYYCVDISDGGEGTLCATAGLGIPSAADAPSSGSADADITARWTRIANIIAGKCTLHTSCAVSISIFNTLNSWKSRAEKFVFCYSVTSSVYHSQICTLRSAGNYQAQRKLIFPWAFFDGYIFWTLPLQFELIICRLLFASQAAWAWYSAVLCCKCKSYVCFSSRCYGYKFRAIDWARFNVPPNTL